MVSQTIGSRRQVWNGTAKKTPGGLQRSDLIMNKHRRIVSKKKSVSSKKHNRLLEYGYGTEKGHFGFVKTGTKSSKKRGKKGKKMRGGMHTPLHPAGINDSFMLTGGRSRRRGMAGGSGSYGLSLGDLGSASWGGDNLSGSGGISGAGITDFGGGSTDVQMRAAMAGGRRGGRRGGKKGGKGMRGGTIRHSLNPADLDGGNPLNRALGAS
jgi:hypothetical protein